MDNDLIRRIFVIRNDRFGEFLLNIPALRALKEAYPQAEICLAVDGYVQELASKLPFIDRVISWKKEDTFFSKLQNLRLLKQNKFQMAIMLNPSKQLNILTFLAGIPIRAGYDRKWGFLLTHKIRDLKHLEKKHEVEYNLELVGLVKARALDKRLSFKIEDDIIIKLFSRLGVKELKDFICVHPWTSDPLKQWPVVNFRELVSKLSTDGLKVVIVGGKEEEVTSGGFCANLGENVINLCAKTNLVELAALLKKSRLLISGDSGPVHLACAVGIPVIVLFRNDLPGKGPKRWGPWGEKSWVIEKPKLSQISVDEVYRKAREVLEK